MDAVRKMNAQEIDNVKRQAREETKYKMEAMNKLDGLRQEL